VAAHLIYEGWLADGLTIVEAARARHDGVRRNPWDEVECGHHYARSMSSWALLLALSGFHHNASAGAIAFAPAISPEDFGCFFSTGSGWGSFTQQSSGQALAASVELRYGTLSLRQLALRTAVIPAAVTVSLSGNTLPAHLERSASNTIVVFEQEVMLNEGQTLNLSLIQ
jgi:hypothetical protein